MKWSLKAVVRLLVANGTHPPKLMGGDAAIEAACKVTFL